MKKIKFAVQVLVLLAAFPVLFITGISGQDAPASNAGNEPIVDHAPAIDKAVEKKDCICKSECYQYKGEKVQTILKN